MFKICHFPVKLLLLPFGMFGVILLLMWPSVDYDTDNDMLSTSPTYTFRYSPEWSRTQNDGGNASVVGDPLIVPVSLLDQLHYQPCPTLTDPPDTDHHLDDTVHTWVKKVTFVLAASANHFEESKDAVASVQEMFPHHKLLYYDLGLLDDQRDMVTRMCGVEYRSSPLHNLPFYLYKLMEFRWKPILIYLTTMEVGAVFWLDTSVRFLSSARLEDAVRHALLHGGVTLFEATGHSLFAVTHPHMLRYIPTDLAQAKVKQQYSAVALYLATPHSHHHVLQWLLLCAMAPPCLAPAGAQLWCHFNQEDRKHDRCYRPPASCAPRNMPENLTVVMHVEDMTIFTVLVSFKT